MTALLTVRDVAKSFTMHLRDGVVLPVVNGVDFEVRAGECVVLGGPSGAGKSSLLKMVYGNYGVDAGSISLLHHGELVDLATASPRTVLDLIRGLVSDLGLSAIIVTHDLAVARLLSHRMMVMKDGYVIEQGLTDRVLDDPREPYTQLLVSSILQV